MTNKSTKFMAAFGLVAGIGVAAALPVTMAQPGHAETISDTGDTLISAEVGETISISEISATVNVANLGAHDMKSATGSFKIATNHSGYKVTVKGTAATNPTGLTDSNSNTIPYQGTTLSAGTAGWNLNVTGTGAQGTPASIVGEATVVDHTGASLATGDPFTVTYSVATSDNQPAGTYNGKVTYTASIEI